MSTRLLAFVPAREVGSAIQSLVQLTKPSITRLVVVTTLCGALAAPTAVDPVALTVAMLALAAVVGSANALNMYWERDTDALMDRTRLRPLPAGRLAPEHALWFALALGFVGLSALALFVNPLSAVLATLALGSYVLVYTPLKRVSPWALHVGAVPGAIPPLIGWAAVEGSIGRPAWFLAAILLVWQLPHFIAIAIFRRSEYARARLPVLPLARGLAASKRALAAYATLLLATSLLPAFAGDASVYYAAAAAVSGVAFLTVAVYGLKASADKAWARALFFASMPHLVVLFTSLVIDLRF